MKLEQLMPVVETQAAKDQGVASLVVLPDGAHENQTTCAHLN